MPVPDLLRLLAVPVFAWAAWHDVRTRRVPSWTWYPLVGLGAVLLVWEFAALPPDPFARRLFLVRAGLSVGLLGLLGLGFWYVGGFGGADAKAFFTIGVLYPTVPAYAVGPVDLPLVTPPLGVFSLTVLTDAVLLGVLFPVVLAAANAAQGRVGLRGFLYRPVAVEDLPRTVGSLPLGSVPDAPAGRRLVHYLSMLDPRRDRLDLDALRMYLRWRGLALSDVRAHPDQLRRPATLPAEPNPPTDGAVDPNADPEPAGGIPAAAFGGEADDPWGAEAFIEAVGGAYGTTAEQLRDGLELLVEPDEVMVSPGLPFLVPVVAGLVVALVVGDLLWALLTLLGWA